jgi:cell wall-associated protease
MQYTFRKLLLFGLLSGLTINTTAQEISKNWFNMDPELDQFAGVSSDRSYSSLLEGKQGTTVIVAVIDGGTDALHPDLDDNVWKNPGEIPGNGIDDDQNGYKDDIHGWNFIGNDTSDVQYDNLESTRIYKKYHDKFEGKKSNQFKGEEKQQFLEFEKAKNKMESGLKEALVELEFYSLALKHLDTLKTGINKEVITADDIRSFPDKDDAFNKIKGSIAEAIQEGTSFDEIYGDIREGFQVYEAQVKYHYNPSYESRFLVGDNYEDYTESKYGNNRVKGPDALHGTHVAGIIGAERTNEEGIKGVASNVRLMILRVVPDGDERDKDVANAIRYAADNGARIINMSFGKSFSPGKKYVDEAVRYAASKDVLLIHASGNDASNNDEVSNFPNPFYSDSKTREPAWIEVGAISSGGHVAPFSNYGKKSVDLFGPGVNIYSTVPDGNYENENGTSMAAPTVSGVAAILRSYYPQLNAIKVKQIILDSTVKVPFKTIKPGSKKKVKFTSLCTTGGIVNAYRAVSMAENLP